jgi:hypothetical protein
MVFRDRHSPPGAPIPTVSRHRIHDDEILDYNDLSEVWYSVCEAAPVPGSAATAGDDCFTNAMDVAVDACGRVHGVFGGWLGNGPDELSWFAWPGATFDNVSGPWKTESWPEFGLFSSAASQGVRLLITPDGALHLFAITSPALPPGAPAEAKVFHLRHWIRPCEVPFVE